MRFSMKELLIVVAICAFASVSLVRATPIYSVIFFSFTMLMIVASILMSVGSVAGTRAYWIGFAISSGLYMYYAHIPDQEGNAPRQIGPEFTTQLLRLAFEKLHPEPDPEPTEQNTGPLVPSQLFDPVSLRSPIQGLARFNYGIGHKLIGTGCFSVVDETEKSETNDKSPPTGAGAEPNFDELIKLIQTTVQPKTMSFQQDSGDSSRYQSNLALQLGSGQQVDPQPADRSHFMSVGHSMFALLFGWIGGHFTCFFYDRSRRESDGKLIPQNIGDEKKTLNR